MIIAKTRSRGGFPYGLGLVDGKPYAYAQIGRRSVRPVRRAGCASADGRSWPQPTTARGSVCTSGAGWRQGLRSRGLSEGRRVRFRSAETTCIASSSPAPSPASASSPSQDRRNNWPVTRGRGCATAPSTPTEAAGGRPGSGSASGNPASRSQRYRADRAGRFGRPWRASTLRSGGVRESERRWHRQRIELCECSPCHLVQHFQQLGVRRRPDCAGRRCPPVRDDLVGLERAGKWLAREPDHNLLRARGELEPTSMCWILLVDV